MSEASPHTALVTGAGSGIGRAVARALARDGAAVGVADLRLDAAEGVAAEIASEGGRACALACDVSDRASVDAMRDEARDRLGAVSLLVANAGATCLDRLSEMSAQDVEWILAVNLHGVAHCLQAFLPDMLASRAGHVVATASMAGLVPEAVPFHAPYAAAKAGVIAMLLNLRTELAQAGVGCTVFCPGGVATRIGYTPRYRPARFGGPSSTPLQPPPGFRMETPVEYRSADEAAAMLLLGVRENRPLVVSDTAHREAFLRGYVDEVLRAFDAAEAFDAARR